MDRNDLVQPFGVRDAAKLSGDTQGNASKAWAAAREHCKKDSESLSWLGTTRAIPTMVLKPFRA